PVPGGAAAGDRRGPGRGRRPRPLRRHGVAAGPRRIPGRLRALRSGGLGVSRRPLRVRTWGACTGVPAMFCDFLLASAHHLLLFGLVAMLAIQSALLARPIDAAAARRLVGVDRGYGTAAGPLLLAGVARVLWGATGAACSLRSPWVRARVGPFGPAALLSVRPALAFVGWRRQATKQPGGAPDPARVARIRTLVRIELVLVALIFVFAAAMARHGGL